MGVHGLWSLIDPVGKPVSLESLQGKILAIDVSVWLHQALKGMRDKQGNTLHNAHLQVLFNRVCKLLFYKIKPVFVFDGGVPALKKQTLASRRQKREEADINKEKTAKQLLSNVLKHHAVSTVLGKSNSGGGTISLPSTHRERDLFELNPIPEVDRPEELNVDDSWEDRMEQRQDIFAEFQNLEDIDVESEDFQSLPAELRHEILSDLKESRKRNSWARIDQLPEDSLDFSSYQMAKLMKQSKLSQKIENVRKELNSANAGEITTSLTKNQMMSEVISRRIASDDTAHYILVKGLAKIPEEINESIKDKTENSSNVKLKLQKQKSITEMCIQNINDNVLSQEKCSRKSDLMEIKNTVPIHDECHDTLEIKSPHDLIFDTRNNICTVEDDTESSKISEKVDFSLEGGFIKDEDESVTDKEESKETPVIAFKRKFESTDNENDSKKLCENRESYTVSAYSCDVPVLSSGSDVGKKPAISEEIFAKENIEEKLSKVLSEVPVPQSFINVSEASDERDHDIILSTTELSEEPDKDSETDDFIEVTIDPTNIKEEDLFPSSIFKPVTGNKNKEGVVEGENEKMISLEEKSSKAENPIDISDKDSEENLGTEFKFVSQSELEDIQTKLEEETASLILEKGKQERLGTSITDQIQIEAQHLLVLFGVPFIVSPMEAEAQCAFLDLTDQTSGTITDDSDVWLFGGKRVYKNFFNQSKHVEFFSYTDIEKLLLLNRKKLINLAYLCGCDYTEGIQGVGPVTAMEVLLEFPGDDIKGLKDLKQWWLGTQKNIKVPKETKLKEKLKTLEFKEGFPNAAVYEAFMDPEVDDSKDKFSWSSPDLDLLRDFAMDKLAWSKSKVDEILLPVIKKINKKESQTQVTQFFTKEISNKSPLKSRRVKRIVDRMKFITSESNQSKKGKSSRKLPAKNLKKGTKITGGWVNSDSTNLNLSESSSDSDV